MLKIDLQAVADFTNNDGAHVVVDTVCSPTNALDALDISAFRKICCAGYRGNTISQIPQVAFTKKRN